jgi:hypothetical protein
LWYGQQVNPNYVDAATQPISFKVYPRFYRRLQLNRNNPIHNFLWLTSAITLEKIYKDSTVRRKQMNHFQSPKSLLHVTFDF